MNKQTIILVTASTGISFLMDLIIFSASAGKLKLPPAHDMLKILATGVVMGIAIDYTLKKLERSLSTDAENKLSDVVDETVKKIRDGEIKNQEPVKIIWTA